VVECDHLKRLLRLLNPNAQTPSADTIHNEIINRFKAERLKIQEILQVFFDFIYFKLLLIFTAFEY
jgi:hypothetical protein